MFRSRHVRALIRSRVIVHTVDKQSIRGVLAGEHTDCVVLEPAEFLRENAEPESIEGRAVILLANVGWIQELTG